MDSAFQVKGSSAAASNQQFVVLGHLPVIAGRERRCVVAKLWGLPYAQLQANAMAPILDGFGEAGVRAPRPQSWIALRPWTWVQ